MKHTTQRVPGNGLTLHVHRFEPTLPASPKRHVLLLHGFMDAGGTWSAVAEVLCDAGLTAWAPDFRGFGRSDWVSGGGYYHFADYVADVDALVRALSLTSLTVVGHSMGGAVASYFAAATGHEVERLVLMEGLGPPNMAPEMGPQRMRTWLSQLEKPKRNRPLDSLDAAVSRLAANHTQIPRARLEAVVQHLTVEDGTALRWAFDPLHRTTSPSLFRADAFDAFLATIACPVLFVSGGPSGWHPPGEADRLNAFPTPPREVTLPDAGHMMHWSRPAETGAAIAGFVLEQAGR